MKAVEAAFFSVESGFFTALFYLSFRLFANSKPKAMKFLKLFAVLGLSLLAFSLQAQRVNGNGNVTTVAHPIPDFHSVEINGAYSVELIQGEGYGVEVTTDENLQDLIGVEVNDGVLIISSEKRMNNATKLKLTINSNEYRALEINGAVDLKSLTPLYGDRLSVEVNGASSLQMALVYDELVSSISGAASLKFKGEVDRVTQEVSGAASINAFELVAQEVLVDVGGAGSVQVHATEFLNATITGIGSITYEGNPEVEKHISGMGSLARR